MAEEETLPVFIVEKHGTAGAGKVTCPRKDCGQQFIINISGWYKPRKYRNKHKDQEHTVTGRSCPYCFRPSRLPARSGIR